MDENIFLFGIDHRKGELEGQILHDKYQLEIYEKRIVQLDPESDDFEVLFSKILVLKNYIDENEKELYRLRNCRRN